MREPTCKTAGSSTFQSAFGSVTTLPAGAGSPEKTAPGTILGHTDFGSIGYGGATASSLEVNVVHGVQATAALPVCGSLRGEPCRAYQAEGNQS